MGQVVDSQGNIWEQDASAPSGYRFVGKVGGTKGVRPNPLKVQQALNSDARDQARLDLDRERQIQQQAETRARINADLFPKGLQLGPDGVSVVPIPDWKPPQDPNTVSPKDVADRRRALEPLVGQINRAQELYTAGPGATTPYTAAALGDYISTPANNRFDTASAQLAQMGLGAFRIPGQGTVSDRDAVMFDRGNLPNSWNNDAVNEEILRGMKARVEEEYRALGAPPPAWSTPGQNSMRGDAPPIVGATGPGNGTPPESGPTLGLSRGENFTTPQDLAIAAAVNKAFAAGADVQGLAKAAQDAGGQITPADLAAFQQAIQARKAGRGANFTPQATGKRTPMQQNIGAALMSPLGTAATTAVSGLGLNALDGILPDQMKALRAINPNSATVGDIGGAIAGTSALGKIGAKALETALPSMAQRVLGGGGLARFGRQVAGDTVYGAAYGQNVNGDAATGALGGALGSVGGQAVGKVAGSALRGVQRAPAAQYLADQGVSGMTIGQQSGGILKNLEDAATSIPGVGDSILARRGDSITGLNQAAFRNASSGAVDQIGREGLDQFGNVTEVAYNRALNGKQFPLDPQFQVEYPQALSARKKLMPDYQAKFDTAINNRVAPIVDAGQMTGQEYQQTMRGLRDYKGARGADGFERDYGGAIGGVQNTLRQNVLRSSSPETVAQLGQADGLYRSMKVLEDAINRNRKDAAGLGTDMFRPGDLSEAAYQSGKKYGMQNAPLIDLARAAQEVIPSKLPDSGTAKRYLQASLGAAGLGALGGGGTGLASDQSLAGGLSGGATGAASGLGLLALLAAGGTKGGQAAIAKALFNRPASLDRFGGAILKRKGLFGSAAVPLLLEGGDQ